MSGSNFSQPHLTAEEYWNQLASAIRRAGQPVDLVRGRAGFSALYLPALFVLWLDLSAFWTACRK